MRLSVVMGGTVGFGMVLMGVMLGSPLEVFLDPTSIVLVVNLTAAFCLQAHGVAGCRNIVKAVKCWLGSKSLPPEQFVDTRRVVETGATATQKAGVTTALISVIQILHFTGTDNLDTLGPALAFCFLGYFYAHCINLVFWQPLGRWLTQPDPGLAADIPA